MIPCSLHRFSIRLTVIDSRNGTIYFFGTYSGRNYSVTALFMRDTAPEQPIIRDDPKIILILNFHAKLIENIINAQKY